MYDGEHAAECILAASSREQAGICYGLCTGFAKSIDRNGKYLHIVQKGIDYKRTMSKLKVISADASKQDGFNASFAIVDEYHAHRNSKLYDVIKSSMGFRRQPLLITITTAGFCKEYPCYDMRRTNIDILKDIKQDDSRFCIIFTLDEGDDWTDEKVWPKCSPNLGVTVNYNYLRDQVTSALNNPVEEVGVLTKNFNVWTDTSEVWIPSQYIEEFTPEWLRFDFEDFRDQACWIGVDLASTSDLTGIAVMFENEGKFIFKTQAFLPEDAMRTSPNRDQYREYVKDGDIILTPGNVTDYDYITQWILNNVETFGLVIQGVFYDRWNATQWAIQAQQEGLPLEPFGQGLMNFSGPTKEFERLALSGRILAAASKLMRWCFRNVTLMRDHNENIKPSKSSRNMKIDLVICMIEALGGYMSQMVLIPDIFGINTDGKK
jgi:phage terminase large subunit-like protein